MLALRKVAPGPGGLALDDVTRRDPGPGEVAVAVDAAGICGTDMHIYRGAPFAARMQLPTVLGHEIAGRVEALGAGVTGLRVGERVAVESHIPCGQCRICRTHRAHICPHTRYPGVDIDGGFAALAVLPAEIVIPLPAGIEPRIAALFEPFGIAVHASLEGSGVAGRHVLISGCGPIGLLNVIAARALGARRITATDINPRRLAAAVAAGADEAIDMSARTLAEVSNDVTGGAGFEVMIEYSGAASVLEQAAGCVEPGGELRILGVPEGGANVPFEQWLMRGLVVRGIHGRRLHETWDVAVELVHGGRVDLAPVISHELPLADGLHGFGLIERGEALKVLLDPS